MEWTEDLSVGVEEIDNQHKELFRRINGLVADVKAGRCRYTVGGTVSFLEDYVISHFGEEEKLMLLHQYPGFEGHRAQHTEFLRNLVALKKEMEEESSSYVISVTTNQLVVDWILAHIAKTDKGLGLFLREKGV